MAPLSTEDLDIDLDIEQLAAMGAVSIQAARLDWQLLFILEALAGADYITGKAIRAMSEKTGINQKRQLILTVCQDILWLDHDLHNEIKALMKRAYRHSRKRNILAHAVAKQGKGETAHFITQRADPRQPDDLQTHEYSTQEIWGIAQDLYKLVIDCARMHAPIEAEIDRIRKALSQILP